MQTRNTPALWIVIPALWLCPNALANGGASAEAADAFRAANPGYIERAGNFYRKDYLPGAVANLVEAVDHPRFTQEDATALLDELIDDFLHAYVAGGGRVAYDTHQQMIEDMDAAVMNRVDDRPAFERYRAWRKTRDRGVNPLAFLMHPTRRVALTLDQAARDAGWRLSYLSDRAAATYDETLTTAPLEVIRIERDQPAQRLDLLVHRLDRAQAEQVRAMIEPRPSLQLFWRDVDDLLLVHSQSPLAELEPLVTDLRLQVLNQY
jgi:hypothetical protein